MSKAVIKKLVAKVVFFLNINKSNIHVTLAKVLQLVNILCKLFLSEKMDAIFLF